MFYFSNNLKCNKLLLLLLLIWVFTGNLNQSTKDTEDKKPEHSKENRKATGDHRTGEIRKKTFVPLFLLKETEEAKEESHEQRKKTWGKTGETTEPEKKLETKEKS